MHEPGAGRFLDGTPGSRIPAHECHHHPSLAVQSGSHLMRANSRAYERAPRLWAFGCLALLRPHERVHGAPLATVSLSILFRRAKKTRRRGNSRRNVVAERRQERSTLVHICTQQSKALSFFTVCRQCLENYHIMQDGGTLDGGQAGGGKKGGEMEVDFNSSAFEALERDFQEVLSELVGDKSLERFR